MPRKPKPQVLWFVRDPSGRFLGEARPTKKEAEYWARMFRADKLRCRVVKFVEVCE